MRILRAWKDNKSPLTRFMEKVRKNPDTGCWEWTASQNNERYGQFMVEGKRWLAHRWSYMISKGDPGNLCVLHGCDNPCCVNPGHLFLGTRKDNTQDAARKGRLISQTHPERMARGDQHWSRKHPEKVARGDRNGSRTHPSKVARGERSGGAKLTLKSVKEIIALKKQGGVLQKEMAKTYGVSEGTISMILSNKIWQESSPTPSLQ